MKAPTFNAELRGPGLFKGGLRGFADLRAGDGVMLTRESDNSADVNAIRVTDRHDQDVGYIAREVAAMMAPLMDGGVMYLGSVSRGPKVRWVGKQFFVRRGSVLIRCTPIPPPSKKVERKTSAPIPPQHVNSRSTILEEIDQ